MKLILLLLLNFLLFSCYQAKIKSVNHPYSLKEVKIAKDNVIKKLNIEKVQTADSVETYVSDKTLYGFVNILEKINDDSTRVNFITTSPSVKVPII